MVGGRPFRNNKIFILVVVIVVLSYLQLRCVLSNNHNNSSSNSNPGFDKFDRNTRRIDQPVKTHEGEETTVPTNAQQHNEQHKHEEEDLQQHRQEHHSNLQPQKQQQQQKEHHRSDDGQTRAEKAAPFPRVRIVVFTMNRLPGLRRLIGSLLAADYMGHANVALQIMVDYPKPDKKEKRGFDDAGGSSANSNVGAKKNEATRRYIDSIKWAHGPFTVHERHVNVGLKKNILEAWYPTDEGEVCTFLEDDIEVSRYWYKWTRRALDAYFGKDAEKLLGVSLYRPIFDELSQSHCLVKNGNKPFLLQQPCSWGGVYFPKLWRDFRNWYFSNENASPELQDHNDPGVTPTSNTWPSASSWKKFLIKKMYWGGWYMVYPNLPANQVLSTNHLMKGEHPTPPKKLFELPLLEDDDSSLLSASSAATNDGIYAVPQLSDLHAYDVMFRRCTAKKAAASEGERSGLPNYSSKASGDA